MNKITVTIKELFDAISEVENVWFTLNNEIIQHNRILIQNKLGEWVDVVGLIMKEDIMYSVKFSDNSSLDCGEYHQICYNGTDCVFARSLSIGDVLINAMGESIVVKSISISSGTRVVYDMTIDDPHHLYKTSNNILHHNTMSARCVAKAMDRPMFIFNCGGGQDARATLIGNTTYKKETGTLFFESPFVKAIQTQNAVILLDELTRGSHDFWNILFPVLDPIQRTLRLDEMEGSPVVCVASGVSFIATANIGNEFTATRVLDRALSRRFPVKLEMTPLIGKELMYLFGVLFPLMTSENKALMKTLAKISDDLIAQCKLEDSPISTIIPPANMVEMAELVVDGFTLAEIAEAAIYPEYPDEGGADSERTFVKTILQKYFPKDVNSPLNDPLAGKKTVDF